MSTETPTGFDKILSLARAECTGNCFGAGKSWKLVHAQCPQGGDPKLLAYVKQQAMTRAVSAANADCEGDDCACNGSVQEIIPAQCVTMKDAQNKDVCFYFAYTAYLGECAFFV